MQFPHLLSECDVYMFKNEWRLYQLECVDESWVKEIQTVKLHHIDYYCSKIFQIPTSSGDRKYNHLSKVEKDVFPSQMVV